jgi:hypothetical protein
MGIAWVVGEMNYFMAYSDPSASVALLSVFRRLRLVVEFIFASIIFMRHIFTLKQ